MGFVGSRVKYGFVGIRVKNGYSRIRVQSGPCVQGKSWAGGIRVNCDESEIEV